MEDPPSSSARPLFTVFQKRDTNEGKRWARRRENATFSGNPHIVAPGKGDDLILTPSTRSTFPEPLPPYLPRTVAVPTVSVPVNDPMSSNAGRFSLSLKGVRKTLRRSGYRVQMLVRDVEDELVDWLREGGIQYNPDTPAQTTFTVGREVGISGWISEVSRTPLQLVWKVVDGAYGRYIVHCCARYHNVVSFSKDLSGERFIYLLRPNVSKADAFVTEYLDTPTTTDIDAASFYETDSEAGTDWDRLSDAGAQIESHVGLAAIVEDGELQIQPSTQQLAASENIPTAVAQIAQPSSPSCSPVRALPRRFKRMGYRRQLRSRKPTFYEFLFSAS